MYSNKRTQYPTRYSQLALPHHLAECYSILKKALLLKKSLSIGHRADVEEHTDYLFDPAWCIGRVLKTAICLPVKGWNHTHLLIQLLPFISLKAATVDLWESEVTHGLGVCGGIEHSYPIGLHRPPGRAACSQVRSAQGTIQ